MTKQSGLGDNFYVAGYNVSGDINSLSRIGGGPAPWDTTDITQSAVSRIGLKRDGGMDFVCYFDPASNASHDRFSALPTTDAIVSYFRGTTVGNACASVVGKQINYDGTLNQDGSFLFDVQALANAYGLEWGQMLTAGIRTDTSATNGSSINYGAATSFGWQAYLHVFAFSGTSVTVTLQDSADNASFAGFTGSAFTAATGITSQRLQASSGTATVRQYVRAITTGTFSNAQFAVMFVKNKTDVTF